MLSGCRQGQIQYLTSSRLQNRSHRQQLQLQRWQCHRAESRLLSSRWANPARTPVSTIWHRRRRLPPPNQTLSRKVQPCLHWLLHCQILQQPWNRKIRLSSSPFSRCPPRAAQQEPLGVGRNLRKRAEQEAAAGAEPIERTAIPDRRS